MKIAFTLFIWLIANMAHAETKHWLSLSVNQFDLDNEIDVNETINETSTGVSVALGSLYTINPQFSLGMALEYNANENTDLTLGNDDIMSFYFADLAYQANSNWIIKARAGVSAYDAENDINTTAYGWVFGSNVNYKLNPNWGILLSADYYHELSADYDVQQSTIRPDFFISGIKLGLGLSYHF